MPPTLRSFARPITTAFADASISEELEDFELFSGPYVPPPTRRGRHPRPPRPTDEGRNAAMRDFANRAQPENCTPRFIHGEWQVISDEAWEEICREEERGRKERRAARLRAERRRGLGREGKRRRFLGGKKGKVVEGGCRRFWKGEERADHKGEMRKVGGRFRARGE